MVARSVRWALLGLAACPPAAFALGLGDIHLLSTLDAPLNAEIEVIGATSDDLASLKPQIASREMFAEHGLDWSEALSNVTLRAEHTSDGRDIIKLQSTQAITEPFITLLVEVDWDRGRLIHEYDVLLDPPLYTPNQGQVAHAVAPPVSGADVHQGAIERGAQPPSAASGTAPSTGSAAAPSAAASTGTSAAPSEGAASTEGTASAVIPASPATGASGESPPSAASAESYEVHRGDTLSRIAARFGGSGRADEQRWMVAAYQANPDAFQKNMNWLRAGTVLRLPSSAAVDSVSPTEASAEVHRQYVAWRGEVSEHAAAGEQPGQLHLVAPGQAAAAAGAAGAGASAAGAGANAKALEGQVQALQSELGEANRRLELQNTELAQLRAQLAAHQAAGTAPASEAASSAAASSAAPAPSVSASEASSAAAASTSQSAASQPPVAAATSSAQSASAPAPAVAANRPPVHKPVRHPVAARPAPQSSWVDSLLGLWWVLLLAIVAVAGFFGLRAWSARRKAGFDDSLGRLAEAGAAGRSREPSFEETSPQLAARESNFLVEETGTHERPRVASAPAPAPRRVESDETISAETAINLDQGDPLAEADFHMAYGLYDQAADLVRIAIQRDPARRDLKLKLLEVFFVWGNKEQFLATARELAETREQAAPGEWEKIVIMGKQLAPDDPLFAGGAAVSGAAAGGVDLDLEGGQHRVDFDVLGEPIAGTGEGVDLDIGTAIGEREPKLEAAAHTATDKNLALDDSLVMSEETTAEREQLPTPTRQMTARIETGLGSTREMTMRTREMTRELTASTRELTASTRELASTREMTQNTRELTSAFDRGEWQSQESSPETPTVERPALQENPTIRRRVETALRQGPSEHTTEVAIDDLGLDLNALEPDAHGAGAEPGSTPDSPTLVAGLDEHSRRAMESSEGDGELKISESGTWHFEEDPFAGNSAGGETMQSQAAGLASLKSSGTVDFEVGEAHGHGEPARANGASNGSLDMDVGTATVPDAAYTKTQRIGSDDLALPDLDPVTMSEVGTKLDLARAYMDMGDPEGARNILEEVLNEGSVAQKQEAERLIASLPG
ncbi:MAG TPA: FimV/HubP family polar landmark protein [Steroidobacteraceae bacterium]|nr:FimV/HubP family polar landmark protein [Steroidobacteraceae bacterium]